MAGHDANDSLTARLGDILARPVDADTRARAALHLLDWFGCALIGATVKAGTILSAWGRAQPSGPCLAIGAGRRHAAAAAFVNGGLGNLFEMDDLHRASIVHPGDVVVPAALAVAERDGAHGQALLDAVVRGYDAAIRIGNATGPGHYRYWHNTATCGVFGAAAAVASLHGLARDGVVDALGQAGTQAAGLWQCRIEPTQSKQLNTARAAQSGLIAADLARLGLTGARQILEGSHGFFAATSPDADPATVVAGPGDPWKIHETSFKPWPACRHAHPAIGAMLALREGIEADAVSAVEIEIYRDAVAFCDKPEPTTPHEARFSLQHCLAVALLKGAPGLADFEPPALADPAIAALRRRVTVAEDAALSAAFPAQYGARLVLQLADGGRRETAVADARGDPEDPMSEDEIVDKARHLMTAGGASHAGAADLIAACLALADDGSRAGLVRFGDAVDRSLSGAANLHTPSR